MPQPSSPVTFTKLTPNLIVANVERSLAFYLDVLGFTKVMSVPDASPFVFAIVTHGAVEIFLNDAAEAVKEYPGFAGTPIGATGTLFIEVEGVDALYGALKARMAVAVEIHDQWYGMREFAVADPDGYLITFAERVPT
jgi:lactoylglutathione lyase